ncbi:hypothetical protein ACFLZ1_01105 [Patescibacteria group bacterium]
MNIFKKKFFIPFFLFILVFSIYQITGPVSKTHWDYFVRLADSFLHNRLYLVEGPSWLNELVPVAVNKFYVVFPPMPAVLLMPFVYFFGPSFSQTLFSQFIGSLNAAIAYLLFLRLKFKKPQAIALSLLLTLGTNHWYLASIGSAWYIALIIGVFFTLLSLLELFGRKRYLIVGLLIGAAYWSRLPTILSIIFPILYILKKEKKKLKPMFSLFLGASVFVILNFSYNFFRFGTIFDVAYTKIPGILNEADFKHGLFSYKNISKQLEVIFLKMPRFVKTPPFIYPSWYGMAVWLTTPAFLLILKAKFKNWLSRFSALTVLIMAIPTLTHSTVGFTQFGYRYALDFTPFLIILTGLGMKNSHKNIVFALFTLSFLVNLWGVLWTNKFGWVGW